MTVPISLALLSQITALRGAAQTAIGQSLKTRYEVPQKLPPALLGLVSRLEEDNGERLS